MGKPLILVAGATGTIGSHLIPRLVGRGARVRALVRDPRKAAALGSGFEVVTGDLARPETITPALAGADKVFVVANGTSVAELEGNVYAAARGSGVRHIVKISGRQLDADFMADVPLAINQRAAEASLRATGIDWTIIRPATYMSNFPKWIDHAAGVLRLPVGEGRDTPTDPGDVADAGVEALLGHGHAGQVYEVTGPEFLTYREMTDRIAKATGTNLTLVDPPAEDVYQGLIASGMPDTQARGVLTYFEAVRQGRISPPTDTIARLLGREPRSFDQWVREHLTELQAG
jgi:(4-alkanoyl-5-oxo-2,5-dihydrofuran-3-yl)methyl phosphate reductase